MITRMTLRLGRSPGSPPLMVETTAMTVFVGPNNSGKSRALREIRAFCTYGRPISGALVVESLEFAAMDSSEVDIIIEQLRMPPIRDMPAVADRLRIYTQSGDLYVIKAKLAECLADPAMDAPAFCDWYLARRTLLMDGKVRMKLLDQRLAGDMQSPPENSLQVLFRNDAKRAELSRIIFDVFGYYVTIDPSEVGHLRMRLSVIPPKSPIEERGLHQEALQFHSQAIPIEEVGDGIRAFIGIISEILTGEPRVILIDEPEAFLHPALAFKLGQEISGTSLDSGKSIFVSTHSPHFLMGCIQSGAPTNILRLTYRAGKATARLLPSRNLLELMRHPLMRSAGVLGGVFYESVVIVEGDTDRAFYQEINERLLQLTPSIGISNCLFLNVQNKQTVHGILAPLRSLGIPAAAIVDIDIVKEGGANWSNLLSAADVPALTCNSLANSRAGIKKAMEASGKDMKRDGGLEILSGADRRAGEDLFSQLREYGIFVVPGGEVECWLKELKVGGHGPGWLVAMFQRMGEDPSSDLYTKPGDGDIWRFLDDVRGWLMNPERKGIPA